MLDRAAAALEQYEAADRKWMRLMGIRAAKPTAKKRRLASSG